MRTVADAAAVDPVALLDANAAAWRRSWPSAERRCWLNELDVLDVTQQAWREALLACGVDDPAVTAFALDVHQRTFRKMSRLFDDVPDLLAQLRKEAIGAALVTNYSTVAQLQKIDFVGLSKEFDAVVISGEVGVAKPSPVIFEIALNRLGLSSDDVVHVGDTPHTDVAGARAAGIPSVWLNRTRRALEPHEPTPDIEIASLRELAAIWSLEVTAT